jgi:hypothetical protein
MKVFVLLEIAGDYTEVIGVYSNECDARVAKLDEELTMKKMNTKYGISMNEFIIVESELK